MPKIEAFESYSNEYDQWFEKHGDMYDLELRSVGFFIPPGAKGLEVGVGSGKFAAPLGIKIGIEPSAKMAQKAKSLGIKVINGVAENLPVKTGCLDFVLMVTTICFVDDIEKAFGEALRILKQDGFIVVGFVDKESALGRKYLQKKDKSRFYKSARFFSAKEVLMYLKKAGFKNFETRQTLFPGKSFSDITEGFGKGSFVVIKASKSSSG